METTCAGDSLDGLGNLQSIHLEESNGTVSRIRNDGGNAEAFEPMAITRCGMRLLPCADYP